MKAAFLVVFSLFVASQVSAFNLYKTRSGKRVRWSTVYVEVVLDDSLAELGSKEDVETALGEAFGIWSRDAMLPLSFELVWDECHDVSNDSNNCIYACSDRSVCYNRPEEKGGTTYVNVSPSTGYITDVDIVLNADSWEWDIDGTNEDGLCFSRVMSHEIGHFLGIDHSEDPEAIMYAVMSRNAVAADWLPVDDKDAATTLYDDFEEAPVTDDHNACSVAKVGRRGGHDSYVFGMLLALFAALRLRSRGR